MGSSEPSLTNNSRSASEISRADVLPTPATQPKRQHGLAWRFAKTVLEIVEFGVLFGCLFSVIRYMEVLLLAYL